MKMPMNVLAATIGLVLGLPLSPTHASMGGKWTPALWFLASEQGGWWEADVPHEIYARRNLANYSQLFSNGSAWSTYSSSVTVVDNATTAPDGTMTASKLVESAANTFHMIGSAISFPGVNDGRVTTCSVYAKAAERSYIRINNAGLGVASVGFNLTTGEVYAAGATSVISASCTDAGNGWWRCVVTFVSLNFNRIDLATTSGNTPDPAYAGDGTSGVYLWGYQVEKGSAATAYQKVTDWNTEYIAGAAAAGKHITNFVDSAGVTPVTSVEQQVGLVLDRRLGLVRGAEKATNGALTSATGWTDTGIATISYSGAGARITSPADGNALLQQTYSGNTTKFHEVTFTVTMHATPNAAASVAVNIGGVGEDLFVKTQTNLLSGGTYTGRGIVKLTSATTFILRIGSGNGLNYALDFTIKDLSVRELPGNHLIQPTTASKPKLYARKNLLTYSEQFDNAAWSKRNITVTANSVAAPDGTITADKIQAGAAAAGTSVDIYQGPSVVAGGTYTTSIYYKPGAGIPYVMFASDVSGLGVNAVFFNGTTGQYHSRLGTVISGSSEDAGGGWWRLSCTYTAPSTDASDNQFWALTTRTNTAAAGADPPFVGTEYCYFWGAQFDIGPTATTYQRINAATDYDTVGFVHTFKFDGVDDFLYTAGNVDFSATDKMTVVAGLTKLSDAAVGVFAELSVNANSNAGSFFLLAPNAPGQYALLGRGSVLPASGASKIGYPAPSSVVVSGGINIAGDSQTIRISGAAGTPQSLDLGTGNFGNYPLYIGRRAGTSFPFNGEWSSLVIRGAATADLTPGEEYAATKHGVTL